MFKVIIGCVVGAVVVATAFNWNDEDSRQAQRTAEQGRLLADLESLKGPAVSRLIDEWRAEYPSPTDQRLTELRVMVERVKADPDRAADFTAAAKQTQLDKRPFEPVLGTQKTKPGLDS